MKKFLSTFILSCLIAVTSATQAVSLSTDGLGQVLIFPYYTVRTTTGSNAFLTVLSVVNTSPYAKAVKVRFLEGKNSKEVLDFNLFLSAHDVWTAGIIAAGPGAGIFTSDNSCTEGFVSHSATNPTLFRNLAYMGDGGGDSLDRTNEGYFEVLEMGTVLPGSALEAAVTHVQNLGSPNASKPTCAGLPITDALPVGLGAPSGGLFGTADIINVADGTDFSYDAVALAGWSNVTRWAAPGSSSPKLIDASPATSVVMEDGASGSRMLVTNWNSGRDAVSAVLMRANVYNGYMVGAGINAVTDWVVTMPTKWAYVGSGSAERPFQSAFGTAGSCDSIGMTYYDQEEQPSVVNSSLCWEVNVLTFTTNSGIATVSNVLHSKNVVNVGLNSMRENGWADLSLPLNTSTGAHSLPAPAGATTITQLGTGAVLSGQTVTYYGLPVVGFAVKAFTDTAITAGNSTIQSSNVHKFSRDIH